MSISRKEFFRKACLSGACLCGFSSFALSSSTGSTDEVAAVQKDSNPLIQEWLSNLISNLDKELDSDVKRKVLKDLSILHYDNMKMDEILSPFVGDLDKFIRFLEENWDWKINYSPETKTLIADENKNYCVCPILKMNKDINSAALCYCSEGFAEKMFSTIAGVPATASVLSSIRRGDDNCKYKIIFS